MLAASDTTVPPENSVARMWANADRISSSFSDIIQKIAIVLVDVVLIFRGAVSMTTDWGHNCDQNMKSYALWCIILSFLDLIWEFARCSLDAALDRLQQDFRDDVGFAANNEENLLSDGEAARGGMATRAHNTASITAGVLGQGVRREKASRSKRTNDLHTWSLVFTASIAFIFSFFSAHDEDCKEEAPSLYLYVHAFTYVYVLRLTTLLLWSCCRTVKNYEDQAAMVQGTAKAPAPPEQQEMPAFKC